ncbi:MAG: PA0069 family radical SAM protein [Chitinophagaceae bacterium]|jgi:DNA repair photolyase|nr:PA0069 family radical SAM protein [Chitinophagaceae bacterium]
MTRGAQHNPDNRFLKQAKGIFHPEAIDEWESRDEATIYLEEHSKTLVNKVDSPDVGMYYSMNPYQGCEHGCAYCYARNTHEYWGYSAGIDFEQKVIVKKNAPQLLEQFLMNPSWKCMPISLSGNTDCYQPAEQKFRITRRLLEVCYRFKQPVSIITKNAYILKDADILVPMAKEGLAAVMITITSLDESLRRVMEPRTTTAFQRLRVVNDLNRMGVPAGVMIGPVIPGLNDHEMKKILEAASDAGASSAAYTFVRLNGSVQFVFREWLFKHFPERAEKVWHLIEQGHGGKVNDNRFGIRMRGEGPFAELIRQQFKKYSQKFGLTKPWEADCSKFVKPGQQLSLF